MATAENTDTRKKKKKRGCFWRIVFWLALVVFIGSVGTLGYLFYTYWQGQNEYEEIASRAVEVPEDGNVANLADLVVDWDALREINPDIVAWVYMPGTIINYPVAHKDGDSEYYLHHNFSLGEGSFGAEFGSIMLSGENAGDFSDEVNILYGHHMRNGLCPCSPSSAIRPSSTSIARFICSRPKATTACKRSPWSTSP